MTVRTLADFWTDFHAENCPLPPVDETSAAPDAMDAPPLAPSESLAGMNLRLDRTCDRCRGCHPRCIAAIGPGTGPHSHGLRCTVCGLHRGWLPGRAADLLERLRQEGRLSASPILRDRGLVP